MNEEQEPERIVRICRPAFQDFHRVLPRYYDRSELNRQLPKLRWWNPHEPVVIDLAWNSIPETDLYELVIERGHGSATGLRILFFEYSPPNSTSPSVWVLGGLRADEALNEIRRMVYVGRSIIVKERANQ